MEPITDQPTESKYTPSERVQSQIDNVFTYHPLKEGQAERYQLIRDECLHLANLIAQNTPECREQSIALTELEKVSMFANAAIARHE